MSIPNIDQILAGQNQALAMHKRIIEDAEAQLRDAKGYIDLLISRNRRPWILKTYSRSKGAAWQQFDSLDKASQSMNDARLQHENLNAGHNTIDTSLEGMCFQCNARWTLRFATAEDHERMEQAAEDHVAGEH